MGKQLCGPELPTGVKSWHSCSSGLLDKIKKKCFVAKFFIFLTLFLALLKFQLLLLCSWEAWMASPLVSGSTDKMMNMSSWICFFTYFFSGPLWSFLWKLNITELTEGLLLYATIGLAVSFLCSCHFYAMFRQVKYVYLNPFLGIHMKTVAVQIQWRHFGIVYSIFIKALSSKAALWI